MQEQNSDIGNRIDTIAKALLRFIKENEVKTAELNKKVKEMQETIGNVEREIKELVEENKNFKKEIEKIEDLVADGLYEIKAKIGSIMYERKKEIKEETSVRDIAGKLKNSGYE